MRAEIQTRSGHFFWAKNREMSEVIGLKVLLNKFWNSTENEFTVPSPLRSQTSTLISDSKE